MIRCYMGQDKVVGYGHQLNQGADRAASGRSGLGRGATGPAHHASGVRTDVPGAAIKDGNGVELPHMTPATSSIGRLRPIIGDADFLYGPRTASGEDTYVLCEINVSSVFPFPEQAPSEIARLAKVGPGLLDRCPAVERALCVAAIFGFRKVNLHRSAARDDIATPQNKRRTSTTLRNATSSNLPKSDEPKASPRRAPAGRPKTAGSSPM